MFEGSAKPVQPPHHEHISFSYILALQKHLCHQGQSKGSRLHSSIYPPQHFLNFFPLPHGHGSFRPTFC
jgi:hypothetical protein